MRIVSDKEFVTRFLWASATSLFLLFFLILIGIVLPPVRNEVFINSIVPWERGGYFATHDMRHYVSGIALFAMCPFLILFLPHAPWYYLQRNRKFVAVFVVLCILAALGASLFVFRHYVLSGKLAPLLQKPRGRQLLHDLPYIPFILILPFVVAAARKHLGKMHLTSKARFPKIRPVISDMVFLPVSFFLLFNPRFAYQFDRLSLYGPEGNHLFHHILPFVGPIHEILHGKSILVDIPAQYGIFATYIPAAILTVAGFSFGNFVLYEYLAAIVYTWLLYGLLVRVTQNRLWAWIGSLVYIKLVFFHSAFPVDSFHYPSTTPLRYFPDILALIAAARFFSQPTAVNASVVTFLVAFSPFYNLEFGISLFLAFIGVSLVNIFITAKKKAEAYSWVKILLLLFVQAAGIAAITAFFTHARSGVFPQWMQMSTYVRYFGGGYFDIPMPVLGAYYFPLSVYLVTYAVLLFLFIRGRYKHLLFPLFVLLYGLGIFVYYVGFNEPHHLAATLHPAIILSMILFSWIGNTKFSLKKLPSWQQNVGISYVLLLVLYAVWPPLSLAHRVYARFAARYGHLSQPYYYWQYPGTTFYLQDNDGKDFLLAADAIRRYAGSTPDVLILSRYDTLHEVMADKTSVTGYSYMENGFTYLQNLEDVIKKLQKNPPPFAFVAADGYQTVKTDGIPTIWNSLKDTYSFATHAGAIDVYIHTGVVR